jgi:hypothetical protein
LGLWKIGDTWSKKGSAPRCEETKEEQSEEENKGDI